MLDRVLEQEVMDTEQDAAEYASFDNLAVNEEFVRQALEVAPPSGRVLDVGTGPADIAVLLAQRAPKLRIVAIDLGKHMLSMARANVARAGLGDRVEVVAADAKATGQPGASFDMIVCNSLVHHIPEPEALFAEMKRLARPGAGLFLKDLHRPSSEAELDRLVDTYARGCTPYQERAFRESLHAGLTVGEIEDALRRVGFAGVEVTRCSDRHWCARRPAGAAGARLATAATGDNLLP